MKIISDLGGTLLSYLRLGILRIKDNGGVLEAKNKADDAYVGLASASIKLVGGTAGTTTISPAATTTDDYVWPDADGASGDAIVTDGSGVLSFASIATADNQVKSQVEVVNFNTGSPITVFTPPASAHIQKIIVDVETAFDASPAASLSVGIAGNTAQYMGATQNDLTIPAVYEVSPMYEEDGTPDAIIITFSPGTGGSTGVARVTVLYANPG